MVASVTSPVHERALHDLPDRLFEREARETLTLAVEKSEFDCRYLAKLIFDVQTDDAWKRLAPSWPEFCEMYCGRPAAFIDAMLVGAGLLGFRRPYSDKQAAAVGTVIQAEMALKQAADRPARGGRPKKTVSDTDGFSGSERNSKSGILRRLARKRPDLLERFERGELSANAAAIEAGFRVRTISVPLDADKAAPILRRHFTGRALARLREIL